MPVIIVGADAPPGPQIAALLGERGGEVRAFVSEPGVAGALRSHGVKVATGDISDASHVGGAALGCHSAVLVAPAATDGREMAFAVDPAGVVAGWATAMAEAGVVRIIWVSEDEEPGSLRAAAPQFAAVDTRGRSGAEVAADVAAADDAAAG